MEEFSSNHCRVQFFADLTEYSWLRTGGFAQCLVETSHPDAIQKLYEYCFKKSIVLRVVGRGTNCIITDQVLVGVVFRYIPHLWWQENEEGVWIDASYPIPTLIGVLHKIGRVGLEFAAGIPGTLGGCIKMNAGTSLGEFKDIFLRAICIGKTGQIVIDRNQINMKYRFTDIPSDQYIWKVLLKVPKVSKREIEQKKSSMREYLQYRNKTQPLDLPTLGSTFKNPSGFKYTAGQLIEKSGLMGIQIGGIQVSIKHANFLINTGGGTARDSLNLIEHIQKEVYKKFRVQLEPEVQILY